MAGGLSSKIKNPDGGIHLAKAKASLGLMEEINTKELKEKKQFFPSGQLNLTD